MIATREREYGSSSPALTRLVVADSTAICAATLWRNNTLQHTAANCSTLQHTATHGTHCTTLQHTAHETRSSRCHGCIAATRCTTLHHIATRCSQDFSSLMARLHCCSRNWRVNSCMKMLRKILARRHV